MIVLSAGGATGNRFTVGWCRKCVLQAADGYWLRIISTPSVACVRMRSAFRAMKEIRNFFIFVCPLACGFLLCNTQTIFFPENFRTRIKQTATVACNIPYLTSGMFSGQLKINASHHRRTGNMLSNGFLCGGLITAASPLRFRDEIKFCI